MQTVVLGISISFQDQSSVEITTDLADRSSFRCYQEQVYSAIRPNFNFQANFKQTHLFDKT